MVDKLIITCCTNEKPLTAREIADEARAAREAGAAIVHVHAPRPPEGMKVPPAWRVEGWQEIAELIRQESDVIYQHGQGGYPYFKPSMAMPPHAPEFRERSYDLSVEKPEMMTFVPQSIDFQLPEGRTGVMAGAVYVNPTRKDFEQWACLCREHRVKPEFEVWRVGAYWNIRWLADKGLIDPPYWCTLAFGVPGGAYTPPTIDELLQFQRYMPKGGMWEVALKCGPDWGIRTEQQLALFAWAITLGGNVRTGMEDNSQLFDGVPAKGNAELVERVVSLARDLGREVATPAEAREMLCLAPR